MFVENCGFRILVTSKGQIIKISPEDWDWTSKKRWHLDTPGYPFAIYKKKKIKLSRKVMGLTSRDGKSVDHINGHLLDNRRENLRICSHAQNMRNMKKHKDNSSGYKGVRYDASKKKWHTELCSNFIRYRSKKHGLGYFDTKVEAALAYNRAARKLHGQFAKLNEIKEL